MQYIKKNLRWIIFALLLSGTAFIWYAVLAEDHHGLLKIAILDIGQGDGIYIEAPNGNQILVDGGPPHAILQQLPKVMPFYDRSIDAIIITNPDADHIGGFIDILQNYKVDKIFEPGTFNKSKTYGELEKLAADNHVEKIIARRGMVIDLGEGAHLDILFPDRDVSTWKSNDGSIVAKLVYGKTSVMLTGDGTKLTEGYILADEKKDDYKLKSDVLKIGHHGSRTSTGDDFVKAVAPEYAAISDGKDNKYGHPHQETLDTLNKYKIKTLRTDQLGTIIFESDGEKIWVE